MYTAVNSTVNEKTLQRTGVSYRQIIQVLLVYLQACILKRIPIIKQSVLAHHPYSAIPHHKHFLNIYLRLG